ncbi:hypothetical protein OQH61_02375 [Helicobacter sp. MIT 21-1697]|uniref:hypothetical protein n=1 Tax=Helicobacter sp. MIT 21-1697 TaxID=2993733 RepID=UPI00224AB2B1|nr:hypothetical protein [Helicobacter sp. MIT 21-1697]MCX2716576.1 hypothetical protein [Helicobacter sp. MIT 21-1697]
MKHIWHIMFVVLLLGTQGKADELKSEGLFKIGLNYAYLTHNAGKSRTDSVHMAVSVDYQHIFSNAFALGADLTFGASVGNTNKHYALEGAQQLTSTIPAESMIYLFNFGYSVGYYLLRRTYDNPLYIGIGLRTNSHFVVSTNTPATGFILASYLPIALRGDIRVSSRVAFEYLLAYDIGLSQSLNLLYDEGDYDKNLSAKSGYGLRLSLGGRYYVSKATFFYASLLASYHSFGASESASISVSDKGTATMPGYITGKDAVVSYPRSSISYVGLQLGIGF